MIDRALRIRLRSCKSYNRYPLLHVYRYCSLLKRKFVPGKNVMYVLIQRNVQVLSKKKTNKQFAPKLQDGNEIFFVLSTF